MRRPRRAPSSGTWAALAAESRADLYASEHADEVLLAVAAEEDGRERRRAVLDALREAYRAGTTREADLLSAIDTLRAQVRRLSDS